MGCACRSVRLAQAAGVMGILLSCLVITPPLLSLVLEDDLALVQPVIHFIQELLEQEHKKEVITKSTLENMKDFLSGFGENIEFTSIFIISASSLNIFMDIFMLIGSCCNVSCLLLPWLILSMLKLIIIWIPVVIFFALLGVYLYVQGLFLPSVLLMSVPGGVTMISLLVWIMVFTAYSTIGSKSTSEESEELESIEPLIPEPVGRTSYNLGQYPQYYPPHTPAQGPPAQQPTAPPQATPPENLQQFYPTLPVT